MAKSTKIIAALGVAAGLGVAAMPLASYADDITEVKDYLKVSVTETCGFVALNGADLDAQTAAREADNTSNPKTPARNAFYGAEYTGSALPDSVVDLTSAKSIYKVVCNNSKGYDVKAKATNLTAWEMTGDHTTINYADTDTYTADVAKVGDPADALSDGEWNAKVTVVGNTTDDFYTLDAVALPSASDPALIVKKKTSTGSAGQTFEVQYQAFVGKDNKAGTYEGSVTYTISSPAGA